MAGKSVKDSIIAGIEEMEADIAADPGARVTFRRSLPYVPITTDQLDWAGELLYGRNWKTEMAEFMGWRDAARIREMMRGRRPIPKHAGAEILEKLKGRAAELLELAEEIEDEAAQSVAAE